MTKLLTFLLAILSIQTAKADCLACWELRKVEIILKNGDTLKGFVQWNEAWIPDIEWQNRFPQSLLYYYDSLPYQDSILVHTQILTVKNDSLSEFIATKRDFLIKVHPNQIISITELNKESKKHVGAGDILLFTQEELDKLNTNPYSIYSENVHVADNYYLSYNTEIDRLDLKKLVNDLAESNPFKEYPQKLDELKRHGVIIVSISYD
jgi:hypothetical protein